MKPHHIMVLALIGVIGACWWFIAGQRNVASTTNITGIDLPSPPPLVPPAPIPLPTPVGDIAPSVRTRALPSPEGVEIIPAIPLETGELPWEATIRKALADASASEPEKGRRILEMIPTMPVEGRETAAEEAIKRIPNTDAEYRHAQAALANPASFGTAESVLFADLMNRPDELRLPTLLMIARNSEHPYAASARDNLNLVLGKDLGTDWTGWDAAVRQHLSAKK